MAKFTEEQLAAIESRGKTIVSASAGSGKTTVMIEKMIQMIKKDVDVSRVLAVTYTKKAAAQMKEKLRSNLIKAINSPELSAKDRQRLKNQLAEVPGADICTIHSFCANLIRTHFFAAGVDNKFAIVMDDDAEGKALKNKAIDLLFDEAYEKGDERFLKLLSVYFRNKSDNELRKIINSLYGDLRVRADYREFLKETEGRFSVAAFDEICALLYRELQNKVAYYGERIEAECAYFDSVRVGDEMRAADELCNQLKSTLDSLKNAPDYFAACALPRPVFASAERARKADGLERRMHVERLGVLKGKIDGIFTDELLKTATREEELGAFLRSGEIAACLADYLLLFDEKYDEVKRERGVLDCADLEHFTLRLLSMPTVREEIREKYRYVFVDEYQDVNPVQEQILSAVAGDQLFLVGDVKQSIYGFRGSQSQFFLDKQAEFDLSEGAKSLFLTKNFRSSDEVLHAVNAQFDLAMTAQDGFVDYKGTSRMMRGGLYDEDSGRVQVHFVTEEKTKAEKEPRGVYSVKENTGKKQKKASVFAKAVKEIIERERKSRWYNAETKTFQQVEYKDIAILSRKKKGSISEIVDALAAEGVPVSAPSGVNIFDYPEIKTLTDILRLIDNEQQDVPLCSALLSMTELKEGELAAIRLAYPAFGKQGNFRSACRRYAEEKEDVIAYRLRGFFDYFNKLKALATVMDAGSLLSKIIADTKMEARLICRENGDACLKRIRRFLEESCVPEPLCVYDFLQRLKNLEYDIKFIENGGEGAVHVLTMHASKGLEYPIVILDNLNEPFHGADRAAVLIEENYGLAPLSYDPQTMTYRPTLLRRLCQIKKTRAEIADELNLYYVALTRAQYGLHALFSKRTAMPDVRYAGSFADFTDFTVWEKYVDTEQAPQLPYQPRQALVQQEDESLVNALTTAYRWQYPFGGYENLAVKKSATGLLKTGISFAERYGEAEAVYRLDAVGERDPFAGGVAAQVEAERSLEEEALQNSLEEGATNQKTGVERGIAYHAFLENFNFALLFDETGAHCKDERLTEAIRAELKRFAVEKLMTAETLSLLSEEQLLKILKNPVFGAVRGMRLYREQQFLASLTANEVLALQGVNGEKTPDPLGDGEKVLFQGAIDLLAISDEGDAWIVDYKYSAMNENYLRSHYALQLALYRKITAKILGLPLERVRCTIVNVFHGFEVEM